MKRFGITFLGQWSDDTGLHWAGGVGWHEAYEIEADIFASSEQEAEKLLREWLPKGAMNTQCDITLKEDTTSESRTGVLFYSRKLCSRESYSS